MIRRADDPMARNEDDAENRTAIPTLSDANEDNLRASERHRMQKAGEERATEQQTHRETRYHGPSAAQDSRAIRNMSLQLPAKPEAPVAIQEQMEAAVGALRP